MVNLFLKTLYSIWRDKANIWIDAVKSMFGRAVLLYLLYVVTGHSYFGLQTIHVFLLNTFLTTVSWSRHTDGVSRRMTWAITRRIPYTLLHDDVIKWKHFPRPVNSPHKGQWRWASMFALICAWTNDWVNNREAGDLRHHRGHCDVNVMGPYKGSTSGETANNEILLNGSVAYIYQDIVLHIRWASQALDTLEMLRKYALLCALL